MKASIILIGDEILLGQVVDTNSSKIARALTLEGWQVVQTRVVGDDGSEIRRAVEQALAASPLVITTGGLGPTKDDITKRVLMEIFGGELVLNPQVLENVERVFAQRGLKLNDLTRSQAMVPSSCRVIPNRVGTAPGMIFRRGESVLISMPGVPFEAEDMLRNGVLPAVREMFMPDVTQKHHTLIVSGITESDMAEHLATWEEALPPFLHLAYLPTPGFIRLRLDGVHTNAALLEKEFATALLSLKSLTAKYLIHDGDASLAEILISRLREQGLTVATAESCTGGNIAHSITLVPGCSDVMLGGVVSYANSVKTGLLGVREHDLKEHGAVSEPVVRAMAEGVCKATGAACAMATSGIAGPGGGTPDKPVGTVWIAVATPRGTEAGCIHLPGNRQRVIDRATSEALLMLIKLLTKKVTDN